MYTYVHGWLDAFGSLRRKLNWDLIYIYIYDLLKNILLKFCFLALYVKLLIDINCVCIIDKTFYNYWCDRLIVVTKKVILVVKLDEN